MADLELSVLEEMSVYARQRRNKAVPICSLPPEVLAFIFLLVRDTWDPHGQAVETENPGKKSIARIDYSLGWMNVSHVCDAWRRVRACLVTREIPH